MLSSQKLKRRIIQIKIVTVLIHVLLHLFKYFVKKIFLMFLYQFNHLITSKNEESICFTDVYTHIHKLSLVFFFSECDRKQPVTIYLMFEITSLPTLNLSH